jgi:hypothetical protein
MSGGGSQTSTSTSSPPQQFLNAYSAVNNEAQNVAQTPLQTYSGNTVAPLSPDQSAGITGVENAQGISTPYLNSASQYINNATTPLWQNVQQFSPSGVQQYESPYTSNVLQTTEASEANTDAQQQEQLQGNEISSGAWGGDRSAVAGGILGGQQALANNQTNANIENTGYTNALGEFNTQQASQLGANEANSWLNSQAGYGEANLGSAAQTSALTGANALLGVGGLEQGQAQAELNVPYEQYVAQQAYPFQTTGWLANIAEGLGSSSGGTSSTTSPAASEASQIAGLGAGSLGVLGATGAFGSNGYLSNVFSSPSAGTDAATGTWGDVGLGYARGGALRGDAVIPHVIPGEHGHVGGIRLNRAPGGAIAPPFSVNIPDVSLSVVPSGKAGGSSPFLAQQDQSVTSGGGGSSGAQGAQQAISAIGTAASIAAMFAKNGGGIAGNDNNPWRREGHRATGTHGGGIAGRASGGSTVSTDASGAYADEMAAAFGSARGGGIMGRASGGSAASGGPGVTGGSVPTGVTVNAGGYAGSPGVPQITTAPLNYSPGGTGIAPSAAGSLSQAATSTNPNVQSYLSNVLQGASWTPPTFYTPPPPAAAAAPPAAAPYNQALDPNSYLYSGAFPGGQGNGGGGAGGGPDSSDGSGGTFARGGIIAFHKRDVGGPVDEGDWDDATSAAPSAPIPTYPDAAGPPPATGGGIAGAGLHGADPWLSLAKAGFTAAAGHSPFALQNIGAGAAAGVGDLEQQIGQGRQAEERQATLRQGQQRLQAEQQHWSGSLDLEAKHYADQADIEKKRLANEQQHQGVEESQGQQRIDQGRYTWQAGQGPDANGQQTNGSWRYSAKGDEAPTFYPGVVQQRSTNADNRQANQQSSLDLRRDALNETIKQHGLQNDHNGQALTQRQIAGMGDDAIKLYLGSRDPITGVPKMTLEQAQAAAAQNRGAAADSVPPAPARPQTAAPPTVTPPAVPRAQAAPVAPDPAQLPDGTVVTQDGVRYRKQGTNWQPVQ